MGTKDDGNMRSFDTGATRDTGEGKLDYEGFLSPGVLEQFAKFMNMNRLQSDGNLRDSDNWQKGIPMDVYRKSLMRHYMEFWAECRHRQESRYTRHSDIHLMAAACGMLFNIMGYMHEWQKENIMVDFDTDEPTTEMAERQAKIQEDKRQAIKEEAKKDYAESFDKYVQEYGDCIGIPVEDVVFPPEDEESQGQVYGFAIPTDLYVDGIPDHLCKDSKDCPICDDVEEWSCPECSSINQVGDPCFCDINEDVQPGEIPLPEWVPSEEPKNFDSLPGAMQALYDAVGEDNILGIRVETNEMDLVCGNCRFAPCSFMDHPCDCCDDNYSNFSKK
jgi:hypothetical protein